MANDDHTVAIAMSALWQRKLHLKTQNVVLDRTLQLREVPVEFLTDKEVKKLAEKV